MVIIRDQKFFPLRAQPERHTVYTGTQHQLGQGVLFWKNWTIPSVLLKEREIYPQWPSALQPGVRKQSHSPMADTESRCYYSTLLKASQLFRLQNNSQKYQPWSIESCQSNTTLEEGKKLSSALISRISFSTVPADHKQTDKNKRTIRHLWSLFSNLMCSCFSYRATFSVQQDSKKGKGLCIQHITQCVNSHSEEY